MQKTNPRPRADWTPLSDTKFFRAGKRFLRWCGLFVLGSCAALFLGYVILKSQPLPEPKQPLTTKIYSDDGAIIGELHRGEKRDYVPLEQMPSALINAVLAIEDRHFYSHFGISPRGIARALWTDLKQRAIVEGASTITQQLARNLYLGQDRTWTRKLKEMKYALQLEIHFDKDKILEMYLNEIYFGEQAYGVAEAANMYFDKPLRKLSVAECALLAGIPKGAGVYSPYLHPDNAKKRQLVVLEAMRDVGYLTAEEVAAAKREPLAYKPPRAVKVRAPYFRDYVRQLAINRYNLPPEQVDAGGLRIYTTLDMKQQTAAEQAVQKHIAKKADIQAAVVAVDPRTGYIRAMVGGTDYEQSQYNRVTAARQPGSSFKPFLYLAALEQGMTPTTKIKSEPTTFKYDGQTYKPHNYNDVYPNKKITMREALATSDNIYAVKTHFRLGLTPLAETATKLGIGDKLEPYPSLALGATPVTPLAMSEAYTTLARYGEHIPLVAIKRIEDSAGNVLVEEDPLAARERVASAASSFVLTHMMQGVFTDEAGTAHIVRQMVNFPVAGKTGSTDWDSWLVGFTPELVATVWVGYDENNELSSDEERLSKWIWGTFMQRAAGDRPGRTFPVPRGVTAAYIDAESGKLATEHCPTYYLEYFKSGSEPSGMCTVHAAGKKSKPLRPDAPNDDTNKKKRRRWFDRLKDWLQSE